VQYWYKQDRLPKWRRSELAALLSRRGYVIPKELRA
jgi:hypothetical protein